MLPPDNFQETPKPVVAHRTSPTNLGTVPAVRPSRRTTSAGSGSSRSRNGWRRRWRRWRASSASAATSTTGTTPAICRPLDPKYVSSVDSGNLAGHLIALAMPAARSARDPSSPRRGSPASRMRVELTRAAVQALPADRRPQTVTHRQFLQTLEQFAEALALLPTTPASLATHLADLAARSETIGDMALRSQPGTRRRRRRARLRRRAAPVCRRSRARCRGADALGPPRSCPSAPIWRCWRHRLRRHSDVGRSSRSLRGRGRRPARRPRPPTTRQARAALIAALLRRGRAPDASSPSTWRRWRDGVGRCATPWSSAFSSIRPGNSCRSAIAWPRACSIQLLRPARLRGAPGELHRDRQGRRAGAPLAPPRSRAHAGRPRLGADLVVGIDVRVPDALAGHARTGGQPVGADEPLRRPAADAVRRCSAACRGASRNRPTTSRDLELTYQYSNFGVPGLGLKRGLSQDAVVAPYATALAAMVDPTAAAHNFARLAAAGAAGRFGFYEALDYTPSRLPTGEDGRGGAAPTWRIIRG